MIVCSWIRSWVCIIFQTEDQELKQLSKENIYDLECNEQVPDESESDEPGCIKVIKF